MDINAVSNCYRGMSQEFGNDLYVNTFGEEQASEGVTEFVGGKLRKTAKQTYTLELVAETFLVRRFAVLFYEYE